MRAGGCAAQQTLTSEAASVLKHSLALARRRGHAQVTPLHVAATSLSSRSSLLRRACLKSHHHPLHCRALELCFNVALNRLPTTPVPLLHGHPSLSNALVAALKRAQAHQRRGCIEQNQQQPLLTVKVELEQLVISILDDPSVSRVMREAGFSSAAVKTNVEDAAAVSSVFHCYSSGGATSAAGVGIFSSPCSPTFKHQNPNPNPTSTFWPTHFLSYSDHHRNTTTTTNPLLEETDVKRVLEELTKKRNTVVVGDTAEGILTEVINRVERGESPAEDVKFVKLHLTPAAVRFMKRSDVEAKVAEIKRKVECTLATASGGAIIHAGDMRWTVGTVAAGEYNPGDEVAGEVARLVREYEKVWLVGTASYETYKSCQIRQPRLHLHVVSVPSAHLSLTLPANPSVLDSKIGLSDDQKQQLCAECKSKYENEVQLLKSSNKHKLLPPWLHPQGQEPNQKDDLAELTKKWRTLCHNNHHYSGKNPIMYGRSCSYNSSYPWWPTTTIPSNKSTSFVDPPLKTPSLDCLRHSTEGKEVRITLELGNSGKSDELYKILLDNVPWQSDTISSVAEALSDSKSRNNANWILIQGNDTIGKRRLAHAIAESICGSPDLVLHMNMRNMQYDTTPSSTILAQALGNHDKLVVFVEHVDLADTQFIKFLSDAFHTGNLGESWSARKLNNPSCRAVFVLTKTDGEDWIKNDQDSVIHMTLNVVAETKPSPDHKRKAEESDSPIKKSRLDLNLAAGDDESEDVASDLTRETASEQSKPSGFLDSIKSKFVFDRDPSRERETRRRVVERMREAYEEVRGGGERVRFSVEERVVREVVEGCGTFVDSSFEKWLKDVFQRSLRRVKNGGEGIGVKMELGYGGKGKQVLWNGFMGSSLPKNIHVVSSLD